MKRSKGNRQKEFGTVLRRLRKQADLGLKTVAPKVRVSYTYLSKVENGHKKPSPELLEKLCTLYKTDSDELISKLGQLPPDIQTIIETNGKEVFDLLRERYAQNQRR